MVQKRDRHLCLRSSRTEDTQSSCELGDKVTLGKLSHLAEGRPRRRRKWKSCDSCNPSAPKVRVHRWERRSGEGEEDGEVGTRRSEKKKASSSVVATQARGQEKNKVDVRTRYKGSCGCLRETEGGALCFPRSEEIGPSSTPESRPSSCISSREFTDHGRLLETAYLLHLFLLFLALIELTFHRERQNSHEEVRRTSPDESGAPQV